MMGQAHRCAARRCAGLATAALVVWLAAVLGVFPGASAFALSDNQDSQAIVSTVSEDADSVGAVVLEGTGNAHASEAEFAETLSVLPDIAAAAKEATVQAAASSIGWAPGGGMSAQMLADPEASVHSYAGATMYETAIAEAKAAYPKGTKTAIIAGPGGAWVDALSAAGLAASCGPILFSEQDSMNEATLKALSELGVKSVIIVGG
ncbi:MAG: cell wall-binding repeat-containing protein, partial [Eggerthellaceae bacterium]|nr:cell wall-binding repeat-containing protein [Eggerthellaceae bacterium]